MTWLLFVAGIVLGVPASRLGVAALVVYLPWVALPALAAAVVVARRGVDSGAAPVTSEIAAQLRAGHTLRRSVAIAAGAAGMDRVERIAAAGMPMERVADALRRQGDELALTAAAVRVAARSGGRSAAVFDALGLSLLDAEALRRERRAAAAPAVLAAWIVGGLPLAYLGYLAGGGRLASILAAGGPVATLTVVGALMVVAGVAAVAVQVREVER